MADLNIHTPPAIEHQIDVSRMEEKQLSTMLELSGTEEGFFVKKIQENVFAVGWENTEYFCDKQGNVLASATLLRGNTSSKELKEESKKLFQAVSWQAGYREERDLKTKIYTLYNFQSGENKVVPKNTPEYFQAWKDIEFHYERGLMVIMGINPAKDEKDRTETLGTIQSVAKDGNLRIKDLLFLASQKPPYLTKGDFESLLPIVRNRLLEQIGDPRWDRTLDPSRKSSDYSITKEELKQYLDYTLIEPSLYTKAVGMLTKIEELKRQKSEQSRTLIESTKEKTGNIQPK